jgi:hypothetical protein
MAADPRADAEARWRALIDAQAADLRLIRRRWPDQQHPDVVAARARLRARSAPDGLADQVMEVVREVYGGAVPDLVSERLQQYVVDHLHPGQPEPTDER